MVNETVVTPKPLQDDAETHQTVAMKPTKDPATGSIDRFIARHAEKTAAPLTIDEMNEIAASGWAGTDQET